MIIVFGEHGQLASELREILPTSSTLFLGRHSIDLKNEEQVRQIIERTAPQWVINAAAYTQVDKAESEKEMAYLVNAHFPTLLGHWSHELNYQLIHISTDYVFNGTHFRAYREDDPTGPLGIYGQSKLLGEQGIQKANGQAIIIRTSWVYSHYGHNFVKTMLKLAKEKKELRVVCDQIGRPTYAKDLALALLHIMQKRPQLKGTDIYHYSNHGVASWYDFAKAIMDINKLPVRVIPITTEEFPTPAKRPSYGLLDTRKICQQFDLEIPHWRDSLATCLQQLANT